MPAFLLRFGAAAFLISLLSTASAAPIEARVATLDQGVEAARVELAQFFGRPPAPIPNTDQGYAPAQAQDAAGLGVRVDRLENQLRALNGQIEQLQFAQKRLDDQMRKFQQDVDLRFQDLGRTPASPAAPAPRPRRSDAEGLPSDPTYADAGPTVIMAPPAATGRTRRNDAFDPSAAPNAPGAPRTIGSLLGTDDPAAVGDPPARTASLPSGPIGGDAPLDLSQGGRNAGVVRPAAPPQVASIPAAPPVPRIDALGNAPATTVRDEYDTAVAFLNSGQFDAAESSLKTFLDRHPKDRLAPDATFMLGQSYEKRGLARDAATQYLKVSTTYDKSARAPEALIRLGAALEKLGAKEQACASYGKVGHDYPAASAAIRTSADREYKRAQCTG